MRRIIYLIFSLAMFLKAEPEHSLLSLEQNPYSLYIKTLIEEQKLSQAKIRELLKSDKRTIRGSLLKGLYNQYHKQNDQRASFYYDGILNKVPHLVKDTSNSMFLADYLVIKNRFTEINKILTLNYCNTLLTEEEGKCVYYVYLGKKYSLQETLRERAILRERSRRDILSLLKKRGEI